MGVSPKTHTTPPGFCWLALRLISTRESNSRISLSCFPPSLPCLIAFCIAFARCCIRRWPCVVCMYTLPGLPAGAPRPARVNPNWDKTKATRGALPGFSPFIHQLHQSGKTPQGARRYFGLVLSKPTVRVSSTVSSGLVHPVPGNVRELSETCGL